MAEGMQEFWDARARENAPYFVDNTLGYRDADLNAFWAGGPKVVDGILDRLGVELRADDEVVEIGCGVGRLTRVLAERARSVRALDVSGEMLARARELNPQLDNVEWMLGDGRTLTGIADASADACFSHVVFQHIPDPQITLGYVREMGRVLRPGGWTAFQVSNNPAIHRAPSGLRGLLLRVGAAFGRAPRGQYQPEWLGSAVDLGDLRSAATDGGMSVERVFGEGTQFCLVLLRR